MEFPINRVRINRAWPVQGKGGKWLQRLCAPQGFSFSQLQPILQHSVSGYFQNTRGSWRESSFSESVQRDKTHRKCRLKKLIITKVEVGEVNKEAQHISHLGAFLCICTPNTGQLNPLIHRVVAQQSTDWLAANAQFSPNDGEIRP